jgi:hypothetical protein
VLEPLADADSRESVVRGRGTSGQDPGLMLPAFFGGCFVPWSWPEECRELDELLFLLCFLPAETVEASVRNRQKTTTSETTVKTTCVAFGGASAMTVNYDA